MKYALVLLFTCTCLGALSQDSIVVHKDARLDMLTAKQAVINRKAALLNRNTRIDGYRILVLTTKKREEALQVKAQLMQTFPSHKSYTIFQSPNFRLKIGNFLTREDAELLKKSLSKMYPHNMYVVRDQIEYIPTEEELLLMQE